MLFHAIDNALFRGIATFAVSLVFLLGSNPQSAQASSSVFYNFNTAGSLAADFDDYISSGTITQSTSGGISEGGTSTGAISSPGSANAVFASKATYSLGPIDSTYTFSAFLESVGPSGHSGMGFSALTPSSSNAAVSGGIFRPNDALGVSVHGGGLVFHNGATDQPFHWNSAGWTGQSIAGVQYFSIKPLSLGFPPLTGPGGSDALLNGHIIPTTTETSRWYKIVLKITRTGSSTFTMRVEAYRAKSDGTLVDPSADAIFEARGAQNNSLASAPAIKSYINFSGDRVRNFDNFQIDLEGSTVIQPGTPVVLTTGVSETSGSVIVTGNVSSDGGNAVSERGFVYSSSQDPTIADAKIVSTGTTGVYSETVNSLPDGTYYFRAFATNSVGTNYGVNQVVTIGAAVGSAQSSGSTSSTQPAVPGELARTGLSDSNWQFGILGAALISVGVAVFAISREQRVAR
jgi:hypothetical protein